MGLQCGLRFAQFVFSLIAFSVMASSRHEGANFNDFHAFSFLVAVTFLSGLWSFVLTVTTLVKIIFGNKEFTSKFYLAQYFLDAFFTLMVWGAACAAAGVATQNATSHGNNMSVCEFIRESKSGTTFCHKTEAAIAMCFFTSFFWMATFVLMSRTTASKY